MIIKSTFPEWNDLDFYLLKLRLDDIDKIGFLYYLYHLKQAWRDFWLWIRFSRLVKSKKLKRAKTNFKKEKPRRVTNIKELVTDDELKKNVIELDKQKMCRAYDIALLMSANNMLSQDKEVIEQQVDQLMMFDDIALDAFEKIIKKLVDEKNKNK